MNPNQCRVVLRPRSALEVFDLTVIFIRVNARLFLRLGAFVVLPPALAFVPLCWVLEGIPVLLFAPILLVPFIQAPFTLAGGTLLFQESVTVGEVARQTWRALGPLASRVMIGGIGVVMGVCTFGYGLLMLMPALLYLSETALLERVGVERTLKRALRLAGGNLLTAMAGAAAHVFLTVWLALVCEAAGEVLLATTLQLGQPFGSLYTGQVTPFLLFGMLAAQPLHAIYRLLLYVDVRTRIEGWDLQVSLRAAGIAREGKRA